MAVTATIVPITSNVLGGTGSVPPDLRSAPAAGFLPRQHVPLYYDTTHAGGDPDWPGVWDNVKPVLPGQPRRVSVQVKMVASGITDSATCTWELFNLPQKNAGDTRGAGDPALAVTAFTKPTNVQVIRGVRPGRRLLAVGADPTHPTQYQPVPQYLDLPAPVFKRVSGIRVVVDLPVPDPDEQTQYLVDLFVPGVFTVPISAATIQVAVDAAGQVVVNAPPVANPFPAPNLDMTFTVPGATDCDNIAELRALNYTGDAWTTGQFLVAANGAKYHWTGTDWALGAA